MSNNMYACYRNFVRSVTDNCFTRGVSAVATKVSTAIMAKVDMIAGCFFGKKVPAAKPTTQPRPVVTTTVPAKPAVAPVAQSVLGQVSTNPAAPAPAAPGTPVPMNLVPPAPVLPTPVRGSPVLPAPASRNLVPLAPVPPVLVPPALVPPAPVPGSPVPPELVPLTPVPPSSAEPRVVGPRRTMSEPQMPDFIENVNNNGRSYSEGARPRFDFERSGSTTESDSRASSDDSSSSSSSGERSENRQTPAQPTLSDILGSDESASEEPAVPQRPRRERRQPEYYGNWDGQLADRPARRLESPQSSDSDSSSSRASSPVAPSYSQDSVQEEEPAPQPTPAKKPVEQTAAAFRPRRTTKEPSRLGW